MRPAVSASITFIRQKSSHVHTAFSIQHLFDYAIFSGTMNGDMNNIIVNLVYKQCISIWQSFLEI